MSRCTGHCCREFILWSGKDKLHQNWVEDWKLRNGTGAIQLTEDTVQVFDMAVPIEDSEDGQYTLFTCKNFDPESGDCTIYESRPKMCRSFPEGECRYDGCTMKEACDECSEGSPEDSGGRVPEVISGD